MEEWKEKEEKGGEREEGEWMKRGREGRPKPINLAKHFFHAL